MSSSCSWGRMESKRSQSEDPPGETLDLGNATGTMLATKRLRKADNLPVASTSAKPSSTRLDLCTSLNETEIFGILAKATAELVVQETTFKRQNQNACWALYPMHCAIAKREFLECTNRNLKQAIDLPALAEASASKAKENGTSANSLDDIKAIATTCSLFNSECTELVNSGSQTGPVRNKTSADFCNVSAKPTDSLLSDKHLRNRIVPSILSPESLNLTETDSHMQIQVAKVQVEQESGSRNNELQVSSVHTDTLSTTLIPETDNSLSPDIFTTSETETTTVNVATTLTASLETTKENQVESRKTLILDSLDSEEFCSEVIGTPTEVTTTDRGKVTLAEEQLGEPKNCTKTNPGEDLEKVPIQSCSHIPHPESQPILKMSETSHTAKVQKPSSSLSCNKAANAKEKPSQGNSNKTNVAALPNTRSNPGTLSSAPDVDSRYFSRHRDTVAKNLVILESDLTEEQKKDIFKKISNNCDNESIKVNPIPRNGMTTRFSVTARMEFNRYDYITHFMGIVISSGKHIRNNEACIHLSETYKDVKIDCTNRKWSGNTLGFTTGDTGKHANCCVVRLQSNNRYTFAVLAMKTIKPGTILNLYK